MDRPVLRKITHIIYHIPGRKVGCTRNLEQRKLWYSLDTEFIILEELREASDQEAGDREWWWANYFGYPKGTHFTRVATIRMSEEERHALAQRRGYKAAEVAHEAQVLNGKRAAEKNIGVHGRSAAQMTEDGKIGGNRAFELRAGFYNRSPNQHSEDSRRAGNITVERKLGVHGLTAEQRIENSRKGGANSRKNRPEASSIGAQYTVTMKLGLHKPSTCPHCGKKGNLGNLKRWHYDRCPYKSEN